MTKTTNYNLNKPEAGDPMRVADFNENADKIDAALGELTAGMPKIVCGTYTGNGAASRTIELGFTPKAVYVCDNTGHTAHDISSLANRYWYGGLAIEGSPLTANGVTVVGIVEGGFQVTLQYADKYYYYSNINGYTYHYIAIE